MKSSHVQTRTEEIANATLHGFGIAFAIVALVIMTTFSAMQGNPWKIISSVIFGSTLIILYTASTIYHSVQHPEWKPFLRIIDHSTIYLLIAGTYTPFTLVTIRGDWGWWLFGVIWGLAFFGVLFKLFFTHRFQILSVILYVMMGWAAVIAVKPIYHDLPIGGIIFLLLGGIFYTTGVVFYLWKKLPFSHAVWHLFVLAGSICQFFAVLLYVIPLS